MVKTTKRDFKSYFWCVNKNELRLAVCHSVPSEGKMLFRPKRIKGKDIHIEGKESQCVWER